ncbi:MAG: hypothetical protein R3F17_16530 [Planctomycetota bacterium]
MGEGTTVRVGWLLHPGFRSGLRFLRLPAVSTAAGTFLWISKHYDQHAVELFGFGNNGTVTSAADGTRFVGATGRIGLGSDELQAIEPWVLFGTGDGDATSDDSWMGVTLHGSIGAQKEHPSMFDWNLEYARRDVDATDETRDAYRIVLSKDTSEMWGAVKGIHLTRTESDGAMHINPGDFNTAGLLHQFGGAWRSDLATNQFGMHIEPNEKLDINLAFLNFDAAGNKNNELDAMVGYPLAEGVHGWLGYGRDEDDREVIYAQMTMYF